MVEETIQVIKQNQIDINNKGKKAVHTAEQKWKSNWKRTSVKMK